MDLRLGLRHEAQSLPRRILEPLFEGYASNYSERD